MKSRFLMEGRFCLVVRFLMGDDVAGACVFMRGFDSSGFCFGPFVVSSDPFGFTTEEMP
jgi:hypothetical protein